MVKTFQVMTALFALAGTLVQGVPKRNATQDC